MPDNLTLHQECSVVVNAPIEEAFAYLDDFRKLSSHMENRSAMMMGSAMTIETDERRGKAVGSKVRMRGKVLGLTLELEEMVTEREPPRRKAWETVAARLLVIGPYRLGFELSPHGEASRLRVFIDYSLLEGIPGRWLGLMFGDVYARWCTRRIASDAARFFSQDKRD